MFGFTTNWFESFVRYRLKGVKKIKLAVIGTPSSGKSYLLSDLIHSFEDLGYQQETLPLSFPYQSFSSFFNEFHKTGFMQGTQPYACRQENHYGAMLSDHHHQVDIEFLNIPGEIFKDKENVIEFFRIKKKLENDKGSFLLTPWENSAHEIRYIVTPNLKGWRRPSELNPNVPETHATNYDNWENIFGLLETQGFEEKVNDAKVLSGKKMLQRIDEFVIDSVMQSVASWYNLTAGQSTFTNLSRDIQFYFLHYCLTATDIIICDKIFMPKNETKAIVNKQTTLPLMNVDVEDSEGETFASSEIERSSNEDFPNLMESFKEFITNNKKGQKPNVYMAFRGADVMLNETQLMNIERSSKESFLHKNNLIYSYFVHNLCKEIDEDYINTETAKEWMNCYAQTLGLYPLDLNLAPSDFKVVTGAPFKAHIESRFNPFKSLLDYVRKRPRPTNRDEILPIPPHTYFTATPIDVKCRIYKNDVTESRRFVREFEDQRLVGFLQIGSHWDFGTLQLCTDMLYQHNLHHKYGSDILLALLQQKI